jgi:hypothetical protein
LTPSAYESALVLKEGAKANKKAKKQSDDDVSAQTDSGHSSDGGRHRWYRCAVLQESILGTADGEYRRGFDVRSLLPTIVQASVTGFVNDIITQREAINTHHDVAREVRDAMEAISGVKPENLPAEPSPLG